MPHWTTTELEYAQFVAPEHRFGGTDVRYSVIFSVASNVRSWQMDIETQTPPIYSGVVRGTSSGDELVHVDLTSSQFGAHLSPVPIRGWRFRTWTNSTRTGAPAETLTGSRTDRLPGTAPDITISEIGLAGAKITWLPSLRLRNAAGTQISPSNISPTIRIGTTDYTAEYDRDEAGGRYVYTATGLNFGTAYAVAAGGGTSTFTTLSPVVYAAPTFRLTARTLTSATYAFDRPTTGLNPYLQVEVGGSWRTLTGSTFTIGAGDEAWNPALAAADAGTAFSFRARWVNSTGPTNGAAATIADSTRARIPEAPQGLAGRYSEPDITFTWTAPSDAADPPTSYEYALRTAQVADLATLTRDGTITAPSTTYAALGVTAFSRYWLYIRAVNVNGTSAWASVSVTTTPEQAANTTSVTVNWTEVEGYDYEIQTSDSEWRTASSPFVLYGLPPGQLVDIDVRALWRGRPGLPATISQLTLPARPAMLANRAYASTTTTATFQFDPAAVGTTEHPITVLCTITGTDDQGGVITQTPTVALDSDRRWTWTATGDFVNQRGLTATFTYRNATGTGPAFAVNFSLTPGAVGVGVLEVTSTSIRVGVPRTEYAGTAVILQFQRGTEGWVNAQDFDPSVGDADNIGVRWGSLTPNTQYAIQARLVQPTTPPTNGPATTLQVYTAPATPTGITVSRRGFATLPTIADITYYHQGQLRDGSWSPSPPARTPSGSALQPISNYYRFYASRISYGSVRVFSEPTGAILTT